MTTDNNVIEAFETAYPIMKHMRKDYRYDVNLDTFRIAYNAGYVDGHDAGYKERSDIIEWHNRIDEEESKC